MTPALAEARHAVVNAASVCFASMELLAEGATPARMAASDAAKARMLEALALLDAAIRGEP